MDVIEELVVFYNEKVFLIECRVIIGSVVFVYGDAGGRW